MHCSTHFRCQKYNVLDLQSWIYLHSFTWIILSSKWEPLPQLCCISWIFGTQTIKPVLLSEFVNFEASNISSDTREFFLLMLLLLLFYSLVLIYFPFALLWTSSLIFHSIALKSEIYYLNALLKVRYNLQNI